MYRLKMQRTNTHTGGGGGGMCTRRYEERDWPDVAKQQEHVNNRKDDLSKIKEFLHVDFFAT